MPPSVVAIVVALALARANAPTQDTPPAETGGERAVDDSTPSAVAWPSDVDPVQSPQTDQAPPTEGEGIDFDADDEPEEGPGYDPVRDSPEGLQATRRLAGGGVLTILGAAMVIGAFVLGASDPCTSSAGNSCQKDARNRGAWVLGVPGAMIFGGGVALLTLGVKKRRTLGAGFTASRTGGGLSLSGRF